MLPLHESLLSAHKRRPLVSCAGVAAEILLSGDALADSPGLENGSWRSPGTTSWTFLSTPWEQMWSLLHNDGVLKDKRVKKGKLIFLGPYVKGSSKQHGCVFFCSCCCCSKEGGWSFRLHTPFHTITMTLNQASSSHQFQWTLSCAAERRTYQSTKHGSQREDCLLFLSSRNR